MNRKRISAMAMALVMAASLTTASLAAPLPEGWTPADGTRLRPGLVSPNPGSGTYNTLITVNGEALESYDFDRERPDSEVETVTVFLTEIPNAPSGYLPLRAVIQADYGSAYWDGDAYQSTFYLGDDVILTDFNDMSISVNEKKAEGRALLLDGVTFVPFSVLNLLEGITVTDVSADGGAESYDIKTPNGTPLMKLAYRLMESADMGLGLKASPTELEEFWGETHGFRADMVTDGVFFLGMMTTPDTLALGRVTKGKTEELKAVLESYRKSQEETFSWYLSENLPKVENTKFVTENGWFLFLIAENADETAEVFRTATAEMPE